MKNKEVKKSKATHVDKYGLHDSKKDEDFDMALHVKVINVKEFLEKNK